MNNIFKDAKFGDKFLTRDGRVAVLVSKNGIYPINNTLVIEGCFVWQKYSDEGYRIITYDKDSNIIKDDNDDIVSKYRDDVDKKNSALENKIKEILHYIQFIREYASNGGETNFIIEDLCRWIYCLTDKEYRKKYGEKIKKSLLKFARIKA